MEDCFARGCAQILPTVGDGTKGGRGCQGGPQKGHGPVKVNGQDGRKSGAGMRVAGWQSGRGAMSVRASHWLDIRSESSGE